METGCLDTGKLNVFKTGKFEEWDDFEVALEAGFKKFSEWNDAKQKNCTKYDDYLVVSSYGWNSFDELEHAKSLNIPVEKSQHYYKLYQSRKLEKAFIEALNFDEADDNLTHVLSFRTGRDRFV